jgi:hypothetical protein
MSAYNHRIGAYATPVHVGSASQPAYNARFGAAAAVQLHAGSSTVQKAKNAHAEAAALQKAADAAKAKAIAADAKLAASLQLPQYAAGHSAVGAVALVPVTPPPAPAPQVVVLHSAPLPQPRLVFAAAGAPVVYHPPVAVTHNVTYLAGGHVLPHQRHG